MKFSKEVFKKHYGKPYLDRIKVTVIAGLVLVGTIVLSIFPVLPLFVCYYVKALNASKRQKQWFEGDKFHVLLIPEDGFAWGGFIKNTKEYVVHTVYDVHVSDGYIEIDGEITLIEKYNGLREERHLTLCRIPRNFSNEDRLLKKLGVSESVVQIFCGR